MRTKATLPLLLLLTLWASPLPAAEPARMIPLLPLNGVTFEVPPPEGYESLPEGSPPFTIVAEHVLRTAELRALGLFTEPGVGPLQGKYLVICGPKAPEYKLTRRGFRAMKGAFRSKDWGLEARKWTETSERKDSNVDPAQTGVFADSEFYMAAASFTLRKDPTNTPDALVMLVIAMDGEPLVLYFCDALTSDDTLPALKAEALRYITACESTGRLRFR